LVVSSRVEQRRECRFKPNQIATVRVLALRPGPILQASVLDISGSGLRLRIDLPLPCGAPIEIEWDHVLAHGKVCRCEPGQDSYELGVQIAMIEALTVKIQSSPPR
jgi:PilZ domain